MSAVQETTVNLPFITATADGPKHLDIKLSRSKFNELTADLVERCRKPFDITQLLQAARASLDSP